MKTIRQQRKGLTGLGMSPMFGSYKSTWLVPVPISDQLSVGATAPSLPVAIRAVWWRLPHQQLESTLLWKKPATRTVLGKVVA